MARVGWSLVAFGLAGAAASAAPFIYVVTTTDDPTLNPAGWGVLIAVGGFVGLLAAAVGGSVVVKARRGKWPAGF